MEVEIKKWGNSLGIIIPKKIIDKKDLKVNDKVKIEIRKKSSFLDAYGLLKDDHGLDKIFKKIIDDRSKEKGRLSKI